MDFYLQFGFNMQVVCSELVKKWGGGTVIMSPRDCKPPDEEKDKPGGLEKHAESIRNAGGKVLVDPQFYDPDCDHKTLTAHGFWPESYESGEFWKDDAPDYGQLITDLKELNGVLKSTSVIVPGTLAATVNDEWLTRQTILNKEARKQFGDAELFATVALSADATKAADQIHAVLEASAGWKVQGIYLICEHPEKQYLVEHKGWLANILDMTAGFRLKGMKVIIGYANQQMLAAACGSATAIASGTHKNKRRFSAADMMSNDEDSEARQTTWYYCPQAYSEFKIPKLDMAKDAGLLDKMKHAAALGVTEADILFRGAQPSTVAAASFKHKLSFKHYLGCMRAQAKAARKPTFAATLDAYKASIDAAEALLKELEKKRVRADDRSFLPIVDFNFTAVDALDEDRGALLRRSWATL